MATVETDVKLSMTRAMYDRLVEIKTHLENSRDSYLDNLNDIKIQLSRLDLENENDIDFEKRFCQPIAANEFEDLYKSLADEEESCLKQRKPQGSIDRFDQAQNNLEFLQCAVAGIEHQGDLYGNSHWTPRWHYKTYHLLSSTNYEEPSSQQWEMGFIRHALPLPRRRLSPHCQKSKSSSQTTKPFAAGEVADLPRSGPAHPHIECPVANNYPANDQKLFRAEILAAVSILATHIRQKSIWRTYFVHPVFVYSFAGPHVRILQIHFDITSETLCVRASPFMMIDCNKPEKEWADDAKYRENEENIKLMLRWMAGTPIGDTSYQSLHPGEDDETRWGEPPGTPSKRSLRVAE